MITGVHYRFLVAYSGESNHPQNKIIAAAIDYSAEDWTLSLLPGDETSVQTFPLFTTVSFINKDEQATKEYFPPPPPVLFKVPYDVFYPFVNAAPPSLTRSSSHMLICSIFVIGLASSLLLIS